VPVCLQLAPAIILFIGMIFMPFSPRWLIHHGREDEARGVLSRLRGLPEDHELVELEFLEIKAQSLFEKRTVAELFPHLREQTAWNIFKLQFVAIKKLFQTRAMFKRVIVATVTMFFQQVSPFFRISHQHWQVKKPANTEINPPLHSGRASMRSCTTPPPSSNSSAWPRTPSPFSPRVSWGLPCSSPPSPPFCGSIVSGASRCSPSAPSAWRHATSSSR
jgi:hypothetical protein